MDISSNVDDNLNYLKNYFGNGIKFSVRKFEALEEHIPAGLAYIENMANLEMIRSHVILPLLKYKKSSPASENILPVVQTQIISVTDSKQTNDMPEVISHILNGDTVLFFQNVSSGLIIGSRKVEKAPMQPPENEYTVFGSKESFTDDIDSNASLIIKRVPVPNLRFEEFTVGKLSSTKVKLIWLEGVANPSFIDEAKNRLKKIDVDTVNGVGVLAELTEDKPLSVFPKYRQTERPDVTAKNLTEGRLAIICSNSPFALIEPIMFWDNFRNMDDLEERSLVSSYLRLVRILSFFLASLLPSLYLSFVTYNQAIVPPALAVSIATGREGVPFPSIVELLALSVMISIIREAGLRMQGSVGYFIGALAAAIIGQAVVMAGYVSPALIIVVAVSTIASFAISSTTLLYPAKLLNYFFVLFAGSFGIFGVITGLVIVFWHLCSLYSLGVPYLYPVLPYDKTGFKEIFVRPRFSVLKERMKLLAPFNRVRVGNKGIK